MRHNSHESVTHQECPKWVTEEITLAGGENRFGDPLFRIVWGWDRIVPFTGEWQEFEHLQATLTDKFTGISETREFIRLKESKIETRMQPKYLPANAWHLEMWRPPEEYGTPETWRKAGEEVSQGLTVDTAGEFPSRGEYELVYPLTSDWTSNGKFIPLEPAVVAEICGQIKRDREHRVPLLQRRAAIEQRIRREEDGFTRKAIDIMKDGMRPFCSETFVTVPESPKLLRAGDATKEN